MSGRGGGAQKNILFDSPQNAIQVLKNRVITQTERGLFSERIKRGGFSFFFFLFPLLSAGFTNTCHANEAGSISVVPGARIVFVKTRMRKKDRGIMFSQVKPKLFSGNGCCDSGRERMTPCVSICGSVLWLVVQASDVKHVIDG